MNYPFFNNDAGRAQSKRPKQKMDCVVRAIAIAMQQPYDKIYDDFAALGRKCGARTSRDMWQEYVKPNVKESLSFPAVKGQPRMNPFTFCLQYKQGTYLVKTAKHLSCVIDGVWHDTREDAPYDGRCVYTALKIN